MEDLDRYLQRYKNGLINDIMPFWLRHSVDKENGGFLFCLDRDGTVVDSDKGVWQHGRFTWLLATLYHQLERHDKWLETAIHGAEFLKKHCVDDDGRMFFVVDQKGAPVRKRRYVFSETFAATAFAALYRATGQKQYEHLAREMFDIFVRYSSTPGLIPPKFTENRPMKGIVTPMIGIVTAQELRENLDDQGYTDFIDRWIDEIRIDFMHEEHRAVMETVGPSGEFIDHFNGRTLNPGHAIEGAWFVLREAQYRQNDPALLDMGTRMLDWMWNIGWDQEYGGIFYFRDVRGLPVQEYWHDMKFWWPHCEAIIATLMAYQLTGHAKYAEWHKMVHEWSFKHFPDAEFGEWYGYLHRSGSISSTLKGNIWKGPFHVPRMHWMAAKVLESIKSARI